MITFGQSNLPGWLMLLVCNQDVKLDINLQNQSIVVSGLEKHLNPWIPFVKVSMVLMPDGDNYSYMLKLVDTRYRLPLQEVAALLNYPPELSHLLEQVRSFSMENFNDGICSTLEQIFNYLESTGIAQLQMNRQSTPDLLPLDESNSSFNKLIQWLYKQAIVVHSPTVDVDGSNVVFSFSVQTINMAPSTAVDMAFRLIEGKEAQIETMFPSMLLAGLAKDNDRIQLHLTKTLALSR